MTTLVQVIIGMWLFRLARLIDREPRRKKQPIEFEPPKERKQWRSSDLPILCAKNIERIPCR